MYKKRREKLADSLKDNSILVLFSGKARPCSEDESYPFVVNRNFYYFTGLDKENMILVVRNDNNVSSSHLFIEPFDPVLARWVGGRVSKDKAKELSEVETVRELTGFDGFISSIYNNNRYDEDFTVYLDFWKYSINNCETKASKFAKKLKFSYPQITLIDSFFKITELRMIKDKYEIECFKKANKITNDGILAMMKYSKPGIIEVELEKVFELELAKKGYRELSFSTIAASGKNATILHYVDNNSVCNDNELFLCDLGVRHDKYCADISRTFPINGKFTERQKEIYQVVLNAQKMIEKKVKPGYTTKDLNSILIDFYELELPKIGLNKPVSEYYFHGVSHSIGLDCHDVVLQHGHTRLMEGMVISNEPGLYIADEGIGIRIEDDLLVTEEGCINFSKEIIKEIVDIENFMKK
jgi:Xaa-Pro aminopeptidase